jgi:hypothetical protein
MPPPTAGAIAPRAGEFDPPDGMKARPSPFQEAEVPRLRDRLAA